MTPRDALVRWLAQHGIQPESIAVDPGLRRATALVREKVEGVEWVRQDDPYQEGEVLLADLGGGAWLRHEPGRVWESPPLPPRVAEVPAVLVRTLPVPIEARPPLKVSSGPTPAVEAQIADFDRRMAARAPEVPPAPEQPSRPVPWCHLTMAREVPVRCCGEECSAWVATSRTHGRCGANPCLSEPWPGRSSKAAPPTPKPKKIPSQPDDDCPF